MSNFSELTANRRHSNPHLDKMITAYAAAAGATVGIALVASAQPAQAKIIYTKTNVTITDTSPYALDLNHDGIADFEIDFCSCGWLYGTELWVQVVDSYVHAPKNAVRELAASPGNAAALLSGALIGPNRPFVTPPSYSGASMADAGSAPSHGPYSGGPWLNVKNRYLGLKFMVHGEVHYGWARMSVTVRDHGFANVVLTGYAYETTVGKSLRAGQTTETTATEGEETVSLTVPVAQGPTLGMLARGAEAIAIWRKKEQFA